MERIDGRRGQSGGSPAPPSNGQITSTCHPGNGTSLTFQKEPSKAQGHLNFDIRRIDSERRKMLESNGGPDLRLTIMRKMREEFNVIPAYEFGKRYDLEEEVEKIRRMSVREGWIYKGSRVCHTTRVKRGYLVVLFEAHNIFDQFVKEQWEFGGTPGGKTKRDWLVKIKMGWDAHKAQNP